MGIGGKSSFSARRICETLELPIEVARAHLSLGPAARGAQARLPCRDRAVDGALLLLSASVAFLPRGSRASIADRRMGSVRRRLGAVLPIGLHRPFPRDVVAGPSGDRPR